MTTAEKIQHINQALCDFFAKNKVHEPVPAKQFMNVFDSKEGRPIRNLLRELDRCHQLHLIPYTVPVRKKQNTNWYFGPVNTSTQKP